MAAHQAAPIPVILQARTLEWVAISFSNAWKWKEKAKPFSCVRYAATPGTAAYQAPPSMGFSRQEYWSGVSLPSHTDRLFLNCLVEWNTTCLWVILPRRGIKGLVLPLYLESKELRRVYYKKVKIIVPTSAWDTCLSLKENGWMISYPEGMKTLEKKMTEHPGLPGSLHRGR